MLLAFSAMAQTPTVKSTNSWSGQNTFTNPANVFNGSSSSTVQASAGTLLVTNGPINVGPGWTVVNLNPFLTTSAAWDGAPSDAGGKLTVVASGNTQVGATNLVMLSYNGASTRTNEPIVSLTPISTGTGVSSANLQRLFVGATNSATTIYIAATASAPIANTTYKFFLKIDRQ